MKPILNERRTAAPRIPGCAPMPGRGRLADPALGRNRSSRRLHFQPGRQVCRRQPPPAVAQVSTPAGCPHRWMSRQRSPPAPPARGNRTSEERVRREKSSLSRKPNGDARSSYPPLSAAQKAGMVRRAQCSNQMADRRRDPPEAQYEGSRSLRGGATRLLRRDMMRIDYGLGRTRAPGSSSTQWIALVPGRRQTTTLIPA